MLARLKSHQNQHWIKKLEDYYYRDEWELYDLKYDPNEIYNVAYKRKYQVPELGQLTVPARTVTHFMICFQGVFAEMKSALNAWQNATQDPWICSPHGVLEDKGSFKDNPQCLPLMNER